MGDAVEFIRDATSPTPPVPPPPPSPPGRRYEKLSMVCQNGRPISDKLAVSSVEDCEARCDATPGCVAVNTDGRSCYTVATCEGEVGACSSWCGYRVVGGILV